MMAKPDDLVMQVWKQQVRTALCLVETITEESRKIREYQLATAVETHASAAATRELLEKTVDGQELWRIQGEWWSVNMEKSLAYWRRLYEAAAQTQSCVTRCLWEPAGEVAPRAPAAAAEVRKAA